MIDPQEQSLRMIYDAFNKRDIDAVLAQLHPDVDWPNGWEGGRVHGREQVKSYWLRQWQAIDPIVEPRSMTQEHDGRIDVEVHQVARDLSGNVLADGTVHHVYTIAEGLIAKMEIRE